MYRVKSNYGYINRAPRKKSNLKKWIIRILVFIALVFTAILIALPPLIMKDMIAGPVKFSKVFAAEEFGLVSERLTLETKDGLKLEAYEVQAEQPKAIVIFLSGIHNPSATAYYGHAKLLKSKGYASILLEMRAHGESEGNLICLGFKEYLDVQAAVLHIKNDAKYKEVPIVVYGLSMGGATAINAIGQIPQIDALVSLSAYSAWEDVFCDNMESMNAPKFYIAMQKPFVKLYSMFKYGIKSYSINPKNQIRNLGDRPALIMHTKEDSQIVFANFERIMENAPAHVETFIREGDYHLILKNEDFIAPEKDQEYSERVIEFLEKHFAK